MPSPVILIPVLQTLSKFVAGSRFDDKTSRKGASDHESIASRRTGTRDLDDRPQQPSSHRADTSRPRQPPSPSDLEAGTATNPQDRISQKREHHSEYPDFSDSSDDDVDEELPHPSPASSQPIRPQKSSFDPAQTRGEQQAVKESEVDAATEQRHRLGVLSKIRRRRRLGDNDEAGNASKPRRGGSDKNPGIWKRIWGFILGSDIDGQNQPFIPNYRYLPILSGVMSPFAILLEIPGLTEPWYVRTSNDRIVEYRKNPVILEVGMAVSMGAAVVANIALIIRFLEKRTKLSTVITIIFLAFHDIINVVTVTIFGVVHRFDDGFTYGEAFWMTVCSTAVSLLVTGTLAWDLYTTPDFALSGSGLTRKQRSLIVIVMILICYIALGSLVYSFILNLTFQDGLYFTVVSLETIGFGDIAPSNPSARVFAIFYNTLGIINVGLAITTTRETIIEAFENSYRKRRVALAKRKHETKVLRESERARRIAIEHQLKAAGLPLYVKSHHSKGHGISPFGGPTMKLNEEGLKASQLKAANEHADTMCDAVMEGRVEGETAGTTITELRANEAAEKVEGHIAGKNELHPDQTEIVVEDLDAEAKRGRALEIANELQKELQLLGVGDGSGQEDAFVKFKTQLAKEQRKEFTTKLVVAWTLFLSFWLVGAAIFMKTEKWSFGKGLYFCWVSFSTIGYGDVTPTSPAGRAIFVVWALMGVGAMTILISVLSEAYSSRYQSALQNGSFERALKSYKNRQRRDTLQQTATSTPAGENPPELPDGATSPLHPHSFASAGHQNHEKLHPPTMQDVQEQLDSVPLDVIRHAKEFHDHVKYFTGGVGGGMAGQNLEKPPEGIRELLNEIAEAEQMDDRMKMEMLDDDESRRVLFMMSYERAFRKLIDTAQKAVHIIALRESERAQPHAKAQVASAAVSSGSFGRTPQSEITRRLPSHSDRLSATAVGFQTTPRWRGLLHQQGLSSEPDLGMCVRDPTSGIRQNRDGI